MKKTFSIALCTAFLGLVTAAQAATASGTVSVFPASTVPGGTVTVHTTEGSTITQPVKATITVTNPGTCVVGKIPTFVGSLSMNLHPGDLRNGSLSLTTPAAACAGTYTVKVTVVNTSTNTVLTTHSTTFTISPK